MDKLFLNDMKEALEAEKEALQEEMDFVSSEDTGEHMPGERIPDFPDYGNDNLGENTSSPEEVAEYSVNMNITGKFVDKMRAIDEALERIENGTYGECVNCGEMIPEERLEANPAAALCMDCAQ